MKNNLKIIVRMKFGSHLYGTNTKDSDLDYKGIFMPSKEEIFLNKIPKHLPGDSTKKDNELKNTKDDIDEEIYSLHYFIKLACEGQTIALDMLHAPDSMILETSEVWKEIVKNREKFYTKNLKAFVSYARRQASKYGIKGSRLDAVRQVVNIIKAVPDSDWKLDTIWTSLPTGEHCKYIETNRNGIKQYMVCGKILQDTMRIDYAKNILQKYLDNYGHRAYLAARNEGIDWKAVSHAMRAAYEVEELLTKKTITFPLKQADFLLEIKQGELDYLKEVSPKLESLMERVEKLSEESDLPKKVNRKFWDRFIINMIHGYMVDPFCAKCSYFREKVLIKMKTVGE